MPRKTAFSLAALWRVGSLALVAALIWCAHHQRWTYEDWQLPTAYAGDAPEILTQMQAASEGDIVPLQPKVIERLGAPFGADWNGYPTPDKPLLLLVGALAAFMGLFTASNVIMMLAPVSAALAFYFVARWLRCRWEWAWAGALLFAFSYQAFHRGLGHFSIALTWPVPLGLLGVWLVAKSRRLEWRSTGAVVCLGSAVALGAANPYNLLFWVQLMGWALIVQWFDPKRRQVNLAIGVAAIAVAAFTFVASNFEVWFYVQEPDGAPLIARNYAGTEVFALKPIEMVVPPPFHRWDALAFLGERYVRWSPWRGEVYLPYLGLIGIVGLIWLALATLRRILQRRALPGQALSVGWLVAYSTIGGLTNLIALLAGIQIFRATNRVVTFISALVLIFLVVRLSRLTARWPAWGRVSLALGVAAFGVLDQVPREEVNWREETALAVKVDQDLGRDMEAALPDGAMVFQLPVMGFPEIAGPFRMADYDLFRPYLSTETLRFSYGAPKFRARSRWQRDLENVPTANLVRRLEAYGFAALYLNRRGYEDRAERLLNELTALGYTRRIESAGGRQVVVLLNPNENPVLPLGRSLTFGAGWHRRLQDGVRWANDDAVMSYFNPYDHPITISLTLELVGVTPREVTFERDDQPVKSIEVSGAPVSLELPRLVLHPGVNRFDLRSSEGAVRTGTGAYQLKKFGLVNSSIAVVEGAKWVE